jgi:DNA mismatch repair protein MutS2
MERVGAAEAPGPEPKPRRVSVTSQPAAGPEGDTTPAASERCDLRGLRVDEALHRLVEALDAAACAGRGQLVVIHGIGTGTLRRAVREHLAESPYGARFLPGAPEEGGEGFTTAYLAG